MFSPSAPSAGGGVSKHQKVYLKPRSDFALYPSDIIPNLTWHQDPREHNPYTDLIGYSGAQSRGIKIQCGQRSTASNSQNSRKTYFTVKDGSFQQRHFQSSDQEFGLIQMLFKLLYNENIFKLRRAVFHKCKTGI